MPVALFANEFALLESAGQLRDEESMALHLIHEEASLDEEVLQDLVPDVLTVAVTDPRFHRINFDAVGLILVDLAPDFLLDSQGRRLMDVLGRLAREELTLAFWGPATGVTGAYLEDGVTAGLNLIPGTVVIPDVQAVPDLRALLERTSQAGLRLLALDGPVGAVYHHQDDTVQVLGQGSVLLASFARGDNGSQPTARLHLLSPGMRRGWPEG